MIHKSFWQNKNVLITGHTGFKGSWLALWLLKKGAKVSGISLEPNTKPSLFDELESKIKIFFVAGDIGVLKQKTLIFCEKKDNLYLYIINI